MKTPTAALAASLLMLGATAHADGGLFPIPGFPGAPSAPAPTPAPAPTEPGTPATPGAPTTPGMEPPLGVQPVPNTPVESLPEHADHANIAEPGPQPGVSAAALMPAVTPTFSREWVVSPSGNDAGDGSAAQPFRTIARAITQANPGEVIRVLAGDYNERIVLGDNAKAGTPEAKITLQGEGRPHIIPGNGGGALVQVRRPNWVIDGFDLDVQGQAFFAVTFEGNVQGSVLANSELHHGGGGAGVTTYGNATGATIENNHIHDFVRNTGNKDSHGVVVQPTSHDITVRNNDIHDNSGDSVQCLGPEGFSSLPPADGLVVENNHFYANRENAVDIKTCHNVVIRNNRMHQFRPTSTAKGDVVVVHYSARNVTVEDNEIYDSAKGISVGGNHEGPVPTGIVVRRNRVHDISNVGGGEGTGIRLENSSGTVVVNNTIARVSTALIIGHGTGGPTQAPVVQNNIVDTAPLAVDLGGQAPGMKMGANLFPAGAQFKQNGALQGLEQFKAAAGDTTSTAASPDLGEAFAPGVAAVDRGADVGLPFCGASPDIGAVEMGC
ncbi:right-handed parallel beta-helix repeat-containing protein [Pyxidicoccus sp. MSG2]|uniref:right-handed parallel beta-helix repeat-containing protein n=1 Tax=Pyxidicoccus sp. MSG2 TaxID=2996790 RepID=UPI00226EDA82|nr:right-handed parallel beta-helix repeat-containing protein [Pyxidicoccus sp. MSG2]MCY1014774.1 right-handed parallel beta-helix repeat-containing protein [Pyxidicoccus sp. MSG2]